jgi:polar amino acid transport system permease protein
MNPDVLLRYAPALVSGFGVTVLCWSAGGALGLILGFVVSLLYRLPFAPLRWLLRALIEALRGTPFLMQLFLIYAGGPYVGLKLSATEAGVVGLGLYSSAYFAEIFRGGFAAVQHGQIEAAMSVGMSPRDTLLRVTLPGALIAAVPPIVNMLIVLSKETVVLSIITVPELMYQMQTMAAETFTAFDAIFAMAVFYWLLVEATSRLGRRIEARVTAFLQEEARPA